MCANYVPLCPWHANGSDEAFARNMAELMRALVVAQVLYLQPCAENNWLALINVAYDLVAAEPEASVSKLAGRVAPAAAAQGLILLAPLGSFSYDSLD